MSDTCRRKHSLAFASPLCPGILLAVELLNVHVAFQDPGPSALKTGAKVPRIMVHCICPFGGQQT